MCTLLCCDKKKVERTRVESLIHYLVAEEEIDRNTHYDDTLMLNMMNEAQNTRVITWVPLVEDP